MNKGLAYNHSSACLFLPSDLAQKLTLPGQRNTSSDEVVIHLVRGQQGVLAILVLGVQERMQRLEYKQRQLVFL